MKKPVNILILEPSEIVRQGFVAVLKKSNLLNVSIFESGNADDLKGLIGRYQPGILLINPTLAGFQTLAQARKDLDVGSLKLVALQSFLADPSLLLPFDDVLSIYDRSDQITDKLTRLIDLPKSDVRSEVLSLREKEVIAGVVKGLTNKQIADDLCISLHTVITHRRNIAAKLDIHSTAGLTIYAIVNNLIDLNSN